MTNETNDITKMPYASWLEQALRDISEHPLQGIVLAGIDEGGDVYANYYELSMAAKILIAGIINQDAMLDTLINSGYIEDDDEEEEDDAEEEE